jgi:gamma-butyrobetaine dioxygenase
MINADQSANRDVHNVNQQATNHDSLDQITAYNPFMGNRLGHDAPEVVEVKIGDGVVAATFADGAVRRFHYQWLRHCCYCTACGNPADGIRINTVVGFDADVVPRVVVVEEGDLVMTWLDGHRSVFGPDWLVANSYEPADRARRGSWRPTTWKAGLADEFPSVDWSDASDGGVGQLGLCQRLRDYGIVRVTGLGAEMEQTEALANLVGPIHETTVYGYIYDVKAEPVARLGAKTGMDQKVHIDDAFYYSPPGIDVFHCLVNTSEGGMSIYVDGFAVAQSIEADLPRTYELLTTQAVTHIRRHPDEIDLRSRGPLISLDARGRLQAVRYFDRALAPIDVDFDLVDEMYNAVREFNRRLMDPAFIAPVRVQPGEGVLIDNHRVLHGRTAFDPTSGRHIRLCHVPRDEFHGRLREFSRRLDPASHDLYLPQGSVAR